MTNKDKRFNQLLAYYAVTLHLSDQLADSGIFESKVKITDYEVFAVDFVSRIASEIRDATRRF
jgi:hypothetical protein